MVKIDIADQEAQAIITLINDAKVPAEMGYALTMLKYKLLDAFKKAQESTEKKNKASKSKDTDE